MAFDLSVLLDQLVQFLPQNLSGWQATAAALLLMTGGVSVLSGLLNFLGALLSIFILPGKSVCVDDYLLLLVELLGIELDS
jgi:hypothetical protein